MNILWYLLLLSGSLDLFLWLRLNIYLSRDILYLFNRDILYLNLFLNFYFWKYWFLFHFNFRKLFLFDSINLFFLFHNLGKYLLDDFFNLFFLSNGLFVAINWKLNILLALKITFYNEDILIGDDHDIISILISECYLNAIFL